VSPSADQLSNEPSRPTIDANTADRLLTFVDLVAHDVKSPLANVSGFAQLIQRLLGQADAGALGQNRSERLHSAATKILDNSRHIQQHLDALHDSLLMGLARVKMNPERSSLTEILTAAVAEQQALAPQRAISLKTPVSPVTLVMDAALIRRLAVSLIANALRYSDEHSPVIVEARTEAQMAVIEVSDQGIGLLPEELSRLFEPFTRISRTRGRGSGAGLGLFAAQGIARLHGGAIEAHSEGLGKGATFRVRLPLSPAETATT
jgi:signal transduction histidine kinase